MASLEELYIMRGCSVSVRVRFWYGIKTDVLRRIIRSPRDEGDLGACALAVVELVLDVEDSVTAANALLALAVLALGVEELLTEDGPVSLLGGLLNNNLLPVVADLVDDPLGVLAELELVEGADALGCDGNTGRVTLARLGAATRYGGVGCKHARRTRGVSVDSCQGSRCMNGRTYPD
jgi:hypothetical protein